VKARELRSTAAPAPAASLAARIICAASSTCTCIAQVDTVVGGADDRQIDEGSQVIYTARCLHCTVCMWQQQQQLCFFVLASLPGRQLASCFPEVSLAQAPPAGDSIAVVGFAGAHHW
jgi:hypothetical protein